MGSDTLAFFRTAEGEEYSLFGARHHGQDFLIFSDFAGNWRGPLTRGSASAMRIEVEGAPDVRLLCGGGEIGGLEIFRREASSPVVAQRVPLIVRRVTFDNGDVSLSGIVVAPRDGRALPGVVFVHGSGPAEYRDFAEFALRVAAHGIVALAYDKRGAGASTGNWEVASFGDLAQDAVAALEALKRQPEVDAARTGVFGASQGTWVGAIAAAQADPAFFISSGGGPVTPADQERYRRLLLVSQGGYSVEQMEEARQTIDLWFHYVGNPSRYSDQVSAWWHRLDIANQPWRRALDIPSADPTAAEWPEARRRFARELHFDPMPYYAQIEAPILGILGLQDEAFPVSQTLLAYNALPAERHVTLVGIPGASHGWFVENGAQRYQAPEAYETMINWIRSITMPGRM